MYDANGNRLWANTNNSMYAAGDLAFGPGNISYFATGTYFPQDPNPYQMAIVKFNAAGNQSWLKSYSVGDRAFRVAVDAQENIVATGMDAVGYTDYSVAAGESYSYRVRALNFDGYSPYSNIATILTLGGICPDFNLNGSVDVADLSANAGLWGQPAPTGYDLDGDGFITIADIQLVAALWGTSCL